MELNRINLDRFMRAFVACNKLGPPYKGWSLPELKKVQEEYKSLINAFTLVHENKVKVSDRTLDTPIALLVNFKAYTTGGWNISKLTKMADDIRRYLGLPTAREVDPQIDKMMRAIEDHKASGEPTIFDRLSEHTKKSIGMTEMVMEKIRSKQRLVEQEGAEESDRVRQAIEGPHSVDLTIDGDGILVAHPVPTSDTFSADPVGILVVPDPKQVMDYVQRVSDEHAAYEAMKKLSLPSRQSVLDKLAKDTDR